MRHRSKDRRQMDYYSGLLTEKDIVKEVKLFDLSDTFIGKYQSVFQNYYKGVKNLIIKEGVWGIVLSLLSTAANGSVLLSVAMKVFAEQLTVGDFSLYSNALLSVSNGVDNIVNTSAGIYEGTLFIDNMITFMKEESTIVPALPEPRHVTRGGHTIEFRDVSFCYQMCIRDSNIRI